jgi:hypothetical protein
VVQRWNGTAWATLGSFPSTSTQIPQYDANVAIDRSGRVFVAWRDQDMIVGTFATRVRVQNGTGWDAWDDLPAGYRPHLVIDDAGNVSMSMMVLAPTQHPGVFRRVGAAWQPLGDLMIAGGAQLSQTGNMVSDASGTLEIQWSDQVGSTQFVPRVRVWPSGAAGWQSQSPLPSVPGLGPLATLVGMNRAGTVAFTWTEQTIPDPSTVAVFVPGWTDRRTVPGFTAVFAVDIDIDPSGRPTVTFVRNTPRTLQVERWSGTAWEAVFDGVQMSPVPDSAPTGTLAYDDVGKPFLALEEHAAGHSQVYVISQP